MRKFLILVLLSAACESKSPVQTPTSTTATTAVVVESPSPRDVLEAYYNAMQEARFEDAYALVDPLDQAALSLDRFQAQQKLPIQQRALLLQSAEILTLKEEGDRATARVKLTRPDTALMQRRFIAEHSAEAMKEAGRVEAYVLAILDGPNPPVVMREQDVFLRRVDGEWRLDFDWDQPADRDLPVTTRPAPSGD